MGAFNLCDREMKLKFSVIICATLFSLVAADSDIELFSRKPVQFPLIAGQVKTFYIDTTKLLLPSHVVFQAHTQWYPVNITYAVKVPSIAGQYAVGTNVGLVSMLARQNPDPVRYSVMAIAGPDDRGYVNVMLSAIVYYKNDPVPGACNLDLPLLENDPNLYTKVQNDQTQVFFAYGKANNVGWPCGDPKQLIDEYVIYQYFLDERHRDEENFMANLRKMIDVDTIQANAHQITTLSQRQKLSVKFAAYIGQGVIYSAVLRTKNQSGAVIRSAAYVPVVTYSCNEIDGTCQDANELLTTIVLIVFGCCGLVVCFFGHRWLLFEMFFFGFLAFQLTSFILLTRYLNVSLAECLHISLGCGAGGGIIWMLFWGFVGSPIFSVLLVGLQLGFLLASILYIMTPLALFDWLLVDYIYHLTFFSTVLFVNIIFLLTTRFLNILSCAVIGSYLTVLASDWFLRGGVRQLILNAIRKFAIPGFTAAYPTMPFQVTDLILCILWILLTVAGVAFQLYHERGRPPFPACPWSQFRFRRSAATYDSEHGQVERNDSNAQNSETDPLLGGSRRSARNNRRIVTPRHSTTGVPTAPHWEPGERMWRPDVGTVHTLPSRDPPPPYTSQPT